MRTHEGWGVMLPCNPPAHYPGESGPRPMLRQRAQEGPPVTRGRSER